MYLARLTTILLLIILSAPARAGTITLDFEALSHGVDATSYLASFGYLGNNRGRGSRNIAVRVR